MRLIIIVLDGVGTGAMPDAAEYGDEGSNTLANTAHALQGIDLPNLEGMGLGNLMQVQGISPSACPSACYGIMKEQSKGKDTITGHWEMTGIITNRPFPTYPNGFPPEIIDRFQKAIGRKIMGNRPASGTQIIEDLGAEHMRTGRPIVYTSADSVFQLAAHESVIPVPELYKMCETAREILSGPYNVARVIARPFVGEPGHFVRTYNRKDYSVKPPGPTVLDDLCNNGYKVTGIGKIGDIFAGQGISESIHTEGNVDGICRTIEAIEASEPGIIFSNLVDFDSKYGHRNDPEGFAHGLREFDSYLPDILHALLREDLLIITADHGNDPTTPSTDHSREMVPLLVWGPGARQGVNLGVRDTFADIAATAAEVFNLDARPAGRSFAGEVGV
ncbi:MAG: phosphopentomutase [Armatimonadota bacterium]|jgi:phosphopentomutase